MNNLIPENDKIAYSEILYLLGTMDEEHISKVPRDLIDFFKKASLNNYTVKIDENVENYTENFKEYTIDLFNVMNLNFWCDNESERRDAITYLLDKPVEFKLNDQMGQINGKSGNYFQEIIEKEREKKNTVEQFKEDMMNLKKKEQKEEKNIKKEQIEEKKSIFFKIKKFFKN